MASKTNKFNRKLVQSEIGTIRKSWRGRVGIVLVYPNRYHVGMSNLGFQTLYRLFNGYDHIVCERAFLPEDSAATQSRLTTPAFSHTRLKRRRAASKCSLSFTRTPGIGSSRLG